MTLTTFHARHLVLLLVISAIPHALMAQRSLYQDFKAHSPGDIITVLLVENVSGSSSLNANSQSSTSGNASGAVSSNILPFDPSFNGQSALGLNASERKSTNQSQLLSGMVSVRIERIESNDQYFVSGSRDLEINGNQYTMRISGYVRGYDIDDLNQIASTRIANAKITYQAREDLKTAHKRRGFVRKAIWFTGSAALIAAGILLATD